MSTFENFNINKQLRNAIDDLGFEKPTPIQEESFSPILSGSDFVGIAQTGTGKTLAYMLPTLQDLKFSKEPAPRVLILVPTRELVIQIVEQIEKLTAYSSVRVLGVYGGTNINTQKQAIVQGLDILVGTPRRVYDLALSTVLRLKNIKKLIIDEVDIMLDFGYATQLKHIFHYLPQKRQNILFSATMTTYVDKLTDDFLVNPIKKTMAVSGTPLENISQECYAVQNFYTKANLLCHLLQDKETYSKTLVFVSSKVAADRLFEILQERYGSQISLIHASKEQNYRTKSIESFDSGSSRVLVATDVISRGIDLEKITNVISFDAPFYPENYIHRIGRTGRAEEKGQSILFYTEKEAELKDAIEGLMNYEIPLNDFPEEVEISLQLTPEEKGKPVEEIEEPVVIKTSGAAFHEKLPKNNREKPKEKKYYRELKEKYKKPKTRGDKIQNMKKKKKRR